MKRTPSILVAVLLIAAFSSCSSLIESTRKMVDGDSPRKVKKKSGWVSRGQYDDLVVKYKNLSEKYEDLKENKPAYSQAGELSKSGGIPSKAETVDIFGKGGLAAEISSSIDAKSKSVNQPIIKPLGPGDVDQEVKTYKKAVLLKENGKVDDSLKVFQFLEKSQTKQIRVRSRIHIGNIYLSKKQFDLALQVFETVIDEDAFSGRVLDALAGASISCKELGLSDKQLRYESMLKDIFGV